MFDLTSKAAYRRQIAELEKSLKKCESALSDERTKTKHLHDSLDKCIDEVKRLVNEGEQQKIIAKNIIDEKRKKIRDLEKEVNRLRLELNSEFDKAAKPIEPTSKRLNRGTNGRFKKADTVAE